MTDHPRLADTPPTPQVMRFWRRRLPNSYAVFERRERRRRHLLKLREAALKRREEDIRRREEDLIAKEHQEQRSPSTIKVAQIAALCAEIADVSLNEMLSPRRAKNLVRARQAGMYIAVKMTGRSLPEIGRRFGGRDHSTVLHAKRRVADDLAAGGEIFGSIVAHVERELGLR